MASIRVHELAKELGVKSTAIVQKCKDEDLGDIVKNHMSTLSAGLAATIREWFSEGEHNTTLEQAEKVDLKKVRVKKKKKKKKEEEQPQAESEETEQKDEKTEETIETEAEGQDETEQQQSEEATEKLEKEDQTPTEESGKTEEKTKTKPKPKPKPEPEPEPEPIKPAGPMLDKPKPAKLSGPQVIRVEKPEPKVQPRKSKPKPKPKTRSRHDQPVVQPLMQDVDLPGKGKKKGKKRKDRTHGRRKTESSESVDERKDRYDQMRRQRDLEERQARLMAAGGAGLRNKPVRKISTKKDSQGHRQQQEVQRPEKATVTEPITVKDLSSAIRVKSSDIILKLMEQGVMATANQALSTDMAELISLDFGVELEVEKKKSILDDIKNEFENRERKNLEPRPVVATMLGHVDHGKTSLLDYIRKSQVQESEAGGITQHVSAYQVEHNDRKITFIDTPGHAAFTELRARGANMTDVVVLVIAADDGVMPQTVEAINHTKAADVQVIVALNKSDLPGVDINKIYGQLAEHDLTPAEWGGDTEVVKTSAITGMGIEDLLLHLEYITDLLELKADDTIPATGWVIEAELSTTMGPTATVLLKEGKLSKGDVVLAGGSYGRIKAMKNSFGKSLKDATSSMPVEIVGLDEVPNAGDKFYCLGDDASKAKSAADEIKEMERETTLAKRSQVTLDNLFSQIEEGNVKEFNVIIRADVQGSIDVLQKYISELSTEEVKIKIIHAATGGVTEGDVVLAEASNAVIIGFNVIAEDRIAKLADSKGVDVRLYTVIYRITEDLEKSMAGMLEPEKKEASIGRAVVRETFKVSRLGTIAGCYVTDGVVKNHAKVRLVRDNIVVRDDLSIATLKHFKDDVREVKAGLECGIKLKKFDDIKQDDIFDFYEIVEVARSLR